MPRKIILVALSILFIVIVFEGVRAVVNPIVRFEWLLRQSLLYETPLGTTMDEVISHVEQKADRTVRHISHKSGYLVDVDKFLGEKSIRVYMGAYRTVVTFYLLKADVSVFYAFDENSQLIDIRVWKTIDSV